MPQAVSPWTWRKALRDHGPQDRGYLLALMMLGTFVDRSGFAFPSVATWARASRNSVRQTQRYLARARKDQWLAVVRGGRGGKGWAFNGYRCCVPDSVQLDERDQDIADGFESQVGSIPSDTIMSSPSPQGRDLIVSHARADGTDTAAALPPSQDRSATVQRQGGDDKSGAKVTTNQSGGDDISDGCLRHPDGTLTPALRTLAFRTHASEAPQGRRARVGATDRIREEDPEVQRKRREANRIVQELTARASR